MGKILLFLIAGYFLIRFLFKWIIFPFLFNNIIGQNKHQKSSNYKNNNKNGNGKNTTKKKDDDSEYISYEEVK